MLLDTWQCTGPTLENDLAHGVIVQVEKPCPGPRPSCCSGWGLWWRGHSDRQEAKIWVHTCGYDSDSDHSACCVP